MVNNKLHLDDYIIKHHSDDFNLIKRVNTLLIYSLYNVYAKGLYNDNALNVITSYNVNIVMSTFRVGRNTVYNYRNGIRNKLNLKVDKLLSIFKLFDES